MRFEPLLAAGALLLAGCGAGNAPSAPSAPTPVAGNPSPTPSATPMPMPSASPPSTTEVLRTASLVGANGHNASGSARIVRRGASHVLELRDDFRVDGGENDVYLARDKDRVRSGDLNLGRLASRTGAQSYDLPNDGGQYAYVIIWCRPFAIPIGVGQLR